MTRRRLPITLVVLGVVILLAAIIAAAVVRASDTATLSIGERPEVPVVITAPGVLDAVDPAVTVRAVADDDERVVLAIGRTSEVEAWLGDADHVRVSGLSSWQELTTETVLGPEPDAGEEGTEDADAEQPAPGTVPDPGGSDLWVVETSSTGTAELSWTDSPGRWSLVAATDGTGPAPVVELEWGREVAVPWLVPGILLGAGLLVAGVTMLVLRVLADREQRRRDEALARRRRGEELTDTGSIRVSISDTDPGTGERLSRRQIREMERSMAEADRRRHEGEDVAPPIPLAGPATAADTDTDTDIDGDTDAELTAEETQSALEPEPESEPDADHDHDHDSDEELDDGPTTPSWRSVWGFADTAPAASDPTTPSADEASLPDATDHDRGERR